MKTFFIYGKPVKAAGIIPYYTDGNSTYFLLQNNGKWYEDFGGKVEKEDLDIRDTAIRELVEESNYVFPKEYAYEKLERGIFNRGTKYMLYFLPVPQKYPESVFGEKEQLLDLDRRVEWVKIDHLVNQKIAIHPRLTPQLFREIYALKMNNSRQETDNIK